MIVRDMSYLKVYEPGELVMLQNFRSPWNLATNQQYEKYKPMVSTLQDESGQMSNKKALKNKSSHSDTWQS